MSCDIGWQHRSRSCTSPSLKNGGSSCAGSSTQTQSCDMGECKGKCHFFGFICFLQGQVSSLRIDSFISLSHFTIYRFYHFPLYFFVNRSFGKQQLCTFTTTIIDTTATITTANKITVFYLTVSPLFDFST